MQMSLLSSSSHAPIEMHSPTLCGTFYSLAGVAFLYAQGHDFSLGEFLQGNVAVVAGRGRALPSIPHKVSDY